MKTQVERLPTHAHSTHYHLVVPLSSFRSSPADSRPSCYFTPIIFQLIHTNTSTATQSFSKLQGTKFRFLYFLLLLI